MAKNSVKLNMSFEGALLHIGKKKPAESRVVLIAENKDVFSGTYAQCADYMFPLNQGDYNILPISAP